MQPVHISHDDRTSIVSVYFAIVPQARNIYATQSADCICPIYQLHITAQSIIASPRHPARCTTPPPLLLAQLMFDNKAPLQVAISLQLSHFKTGHMIHQVVWGKSSYCFALIVSTILLSNPFLFPCTVQQIVLIQLCTRITIFEISKAYALKYIAHLEKSFYK